MLLNSALDFYHHDGLTPVRAGPNKGPVGYWGRYKSTRPDIGSVVSWFSEPDPRVTGIALLLGEAHGGLFALDFDREDWEWAYRRLCEEFPKALQTRTVVTASGKRHIWFKSKIIDFGLETFTWEPIRHFEVELRGTGHVVIGPPSRVIDEAKGIDGIYSFIDPLAPIIELNAQELQELKDVLRREFKRSSTISRIDRTMRFLREGAPEGGRDREAFDAACQLRDHGWRIDEVEEIISAVLLDPNRCPGTPFTQAEIRETIVEQVFRNSARDPVGGESSAVDPGAVEHYEMEQFIVNHAERYKRCPGIAGDRDGWLFWNGTVWQPRAGSLVWGELCSLLDKRRQEADDLNIDLAEDKAWRTHLRVLGGASGLFHILSMVERRTEVALPESLFDRYENLLTVGNGVLVFDSLGDVSLRQPEPNDYLTKWVRHEYHPDARAPIWESFLKQTFRSQPGMIPFLQAVVGTCLTGDTSEHKFFLLYGNGRNGKTTFLNALMNVFGEFAAEPAIETFLMNRFGPGIREDVAQLRGMRFVSTTEPTAGAQFDTNLIKKLTGEDPITARFLYSNSFTYTAQFKLFIACNTPPEAPETSDAFWDRMVVVPFLEQVPEGQRDLDLGKKLQGEAEGILAWAVEGYKLWRKAGGLANLRPATVQEASKAYRRDSDPLGSFLERVTMKDRLGTVKAEELVTRYQLWDGAERQMTKTKFTREMRQRGFEPFYKSDRLYYSGLSFRPEQDSV